MRNPWYMAIILCFANAVAFIDRTSLPLIVQPIELDLHLSDTQMSVLIGFAFILAYSGGGAFAGVLVDRFPRRWVLGLGISLWSAATIYCGFAGAFAWMFAGRLGIGAGESVCGPAAMSLIRDAFTPDRRGRAIAIWALGAGIGGGAALLAGGAILHAIGNVSSVELPVIGAIRSWQFVLICSGLMAIPVALLSFTFPEPTRLASLAERSAINIGHAFAFLFENKIIFIPLFIVNGATIILLTGFGVWMPAILGRVWHVGRPEIGLTVGVLTIVLQPTSQFVAGLMMDRLGRSKNIARVFAIGALVSALVFVPTTGAPIASSLNWTWALLAIEMLVGTSLFTIGTAAVAQLSPTAMVGKVTAIHFAWVGIVGTAVGPTLVATLSDRLFSGPSALGQSLSLVSGFMCLVALVGFAFLAMRARRARAGSPSLGTMVGDVDLETP